MDLKIFEIGGSTFVNYSVNDKSGVLANVRYGFDTIYLHETQYLTAPVKKKIVDFILSPKYTEAVWLTDIHLRNGKIFLDSKVIGKYESEERYLSYSIDISDHHILLSHIESNLKDIAQDYDKEIKKLN